MNKNVEIFLQTEKQAHLFDIPILGENIWQYLRLETFRIIERQLLHSNLVTVSYRHRFLDEEVSYSEEEKIEYEKNIINKRRDKDILIVNNKHRFVNIEGEYICPVTGRIEYETEYSIGYCTQVYNRGNRCRYDNDNDINYSKIRVAPQVLINETQMERYVSFLGSIFNLAYNIKLEEPFYTDVKAHILYVADIMGYMHFYQRLLSECRPKCILFSSYYAIVDSLIIAEAKKLQIPTIEIQHGTIGMEHVAYNCIEKRYNEPGMPDYLAAYGMFDKEIPRNFVPHEKVIPVGNLFLEYMKNTIQPSRSCNHEKCVLVVSFNMKNEALVDFAISLKQRRPNWEVIYRFHPEETIIQKNRNRMEKESIVCQDDFSISIYSLLSRADYVIGSKSTVLYEALYFQKPAFVLNMDKDTTNWQEAERYMPHVFSAEQFLDIIQKEMINKKMFETANYFYQPNGKKELLKLLDNIVSGKEKNDRV